MLTADTAALVIVDMQSTLLAAMTDPDKLLAQTKKLILGARALELPILCLEQNPARLGPTAPEIAQTLEGFAPIPKMSFGACGCGEFVEALSSTGRRRILLAGIETHVCVHQTAAGLLAMGLEVQVVADAVSSRTPENRDIGLQRMRDDGVRITSVEMALFELLRVAEGERFKAVLKIVK